MILQKSFSEDNQGFYLNEKDEIKRKALMV